MKKIHGMSRLFYREMPHGVFMRDFIAAASGVIPETLIAPCGMNCRLCMAFTRGRKKCPGCRAPDDSKPKTRAECRIRRCEKMVEARGEYCFGCDIFPCARLEHLDRRYRTKYGMSMIENLENIARFGVERFVEKEKERWTCPECGETLCVHRPQCLHCRHKWR